MDAFRRDGLVFPVRETGPASGPVVILLHGFPQLSTIWDRVTPPLAAAGYRCLAPDQRGYAPGARPRGRRGYRISELVADTFALADAAGAEQVHLVGHDWGAAVAWAAAASRPDRVRSLAALSVPHPAAFARAVATSRQFLASWYMYAFQLPFLPERYLTGGGGEPWHRLARALRRSGQHPARAERDARAMVTSGALHGAIQWYRALPVTDPRPSLTRATVPVLYVWSDGDAAVLRPAARRCADFVTGPFRCEVLTGVSHWIPDEVPDQLAALLLPHLDAVAAAQP
ncbi:MAG TPA: alpha/beta fold hydrolase [Mycobacteriales bacterium]|jgi:pimeloyl-ACP methyl ester carboxylesterase|nr:alpha/beta fold hydrolase [Mycobacteriales bacterium]